MSVFTEFYKMCTSLGDALTNPDYKLVYDAAIAKSSICATIFWIGALIALVFAALYYFGIGNFVFKLAKRSVWLVTLILTFVVTFFVTGPQIVGIDRGDGNHSTGLYKAAYENLRAKGSDSGDALKDKKKKQLKNFKEKELKDGVFATVPMQMSLATGGVSVLFFVVFSFGFKRFSTHATAIPF